MKELIIEDFTLILSRNCNLGCRYCPLEHFEGKMSIDIIKVFFDKLFIYRGYKFCITLFGGEPLLNKDAMFFIYKYIYSNSDTILNNNLFFEIKLVTNGTLINDEYIELFQKFNNITYVSFIIDISIDGSKYTQLNQRPFKKGGVDYYNSLFNNINNVIKIGIKLDLFLVMDFYNKNILKDILYLIDNFKVPIFLMPVDLTYGYIISKGELINGEIKEYLHNLFKNISAIKKYGLSNKIANFRVKSIRDIKIPPIGPTIDYNGDLYITRDFLFLMDEESKFISIGDISNIDLDLLLYDFEKNFSMIEREALFTYYGRSYSINKKIGDYFTKSIYAKKDSFKR